MRVILPESLRIATRRLAHLGARLDRSLLLHLLLLLLLHLLLLLLLLLHVLLLLLLLPVLLLLLLLPVLLLLLLLTRLLLRAVALGLLDGAHFVVPPAEDEVSHVAVPARGCQHARGRHVHDVAVCALGLK
jgi:hypothetical protein